MTRTVPLLTLSAILAAFASSCIALSAEPAATPEPVRITVDPQTVLATIPEDFLGFGYETSAVAQPGYFSPTNTHLVQLYRTLSPSGLIRIGGNVSDHTQYVPDGTPRAASEKETTIITRASLHDLGEFLRATGWKAMWGLNLGTGTAEEAVEEALAVHKALGDRLQSFQIGNEVDLLPRFHQSYESYSAAYREYKAAIRQALPDAVFSGPDVAGKTAWALDFARSEGPDLKLLTHHYYRTGAMKPEATIATLLAPVPAWEATLGRLEEAVAGQRGFGYRINEVNSFYGGGKPGVSDTFASALWSLDYLFELAAHHCAGVNLQTDINQHAWVSHYSPIYKSPDGQQLTARPEYYGMLAFAQAGHGDLLKVTITPENATPPAINVRTYATKAAAAGPVWVTIINKDLTRSARITLAVPDGSTTAEAYRLTAPSLESQSEVTLAGTPVTPEGRWTPGAPGKIVVAHTVTVFVPAASAMLVRLR